MIHYSHRKWRTFRELARYLVQNFNDTGATGKERHRHYDRTFCWHTRLQQEEEPCECLSRLKLSAAVMMSTTVVSWS